MKIGIDIREALNNRSGKGVYCTELVRALTELASPHEFILYTNGINANLSRFKKGSIRIIKGRGLLWHLRVIVDWMRMKGDVFFSPTSFIIPALLPGRFATALTVHDLVAFLHPRLHQNKATIIERLFLRRALKKTRAVFVPSQSTAHDLQKIFRVPAESIHVTPLGVDPVFFDRAKEYMTILEKYGVPHEYLLTVAGLEPRKNVAGILEALELLRAGNTRVPPLVIVGGDGWKSASVQKKIAEQKGRVYHLNNVPRNDLFAFYRGAAALIFPSLYEGFGLPPLEAMASGCPVVVSKTSSLPEVCGDTTEYVDPNSTESIAQGIKTIIGNSRLRAELSASGRRRAEMFSWKSAAQKTLKIIETACARKFR